MCVYACVYAYVCVSDDNDCYFVRMCVRVVCVPYACVYVCPMTMTANVYACVVRAR